MKGPWNIQLSAKNLPDLSAPAAIMVPNPVSFIAQKILIHRQRKPRKRAQDALYVHDTLELFGQRIRDLRLIWLEQLQPAMHPTTVKEMHGQRQQQYAVVNDTVREAARMAQGRSLSPVSLQNTCAFGLEEIFKPTE